MNNIEKFFKASVLGGVVVVLPLAILVFTFKWLFISITDAIQPLTDFISSKYHIPEISADIAVIVLIIGCCFFIGVLVSTKVGKFIHVTLDKYLLKKVPGYKIIKEVVLQFLGDKNKSLFSNGMVVRAQIFGKNVDTRVTALTTCRHNDGSYTIFVPTGPNPTSGNIYHLPQDLVEEFPDVAIDEMMRTIISCGAGSDDLFQKEGRKEG